MLHMKDWARSASFTNTSLAFIQSLVCMAHLVIWRLEALFKSGEKSKSGEKGRKVKYKSTPNLIHSMYLEAAQLHEVLLYRPEGHLKASTNEDGFCSLAYLSFSVSQFQLNNQTQLSRAFPLGCHPSGGDFYPFVFSHFSLKKQTNM